MANYASKIIPSTSTDNNLVFHFLEPLSKYYWSGLHVIHAINNSPSRTSPTSSRKYRNE